MEHFIDIYKKKGKQEYCVELLNSGKIKVNLKVDGKPFQVLYNDDTNELEYHGRSGNETTIGPLIDDYTRLFSKPVNDAIAHIEPRKEVFKKFKFLTFEVIDNLLLLTAIIDKDGNFINDASEIKKIANDLDTDVMPTLWEGKFNKTQKESILQVISTGLVPEKQAFIDWVTTLFGSYKYFPKKLISASEEFIEGIVFFFDINEKIIEYKIVDPTYRQSMKDRDNKHALEREKRKEYYESVYNLLVEWLSENAKKLDNNQIISLQKNFIELSKDKKFFNKLLEDGKNLEENTSTTYTVQIDRVLPEIKELLKNNGCKNVFELFMKTFYKEKKRAFIISPEFQTKINNIIKTIKENKNIISLKDYIIESLKK